MNSVPLLSFCIPTNGVSEWVFPVLDSIYAQARNESPVEVIVSDNGKNSVFKKEILLYQRRHSNLAYTETNSSQFINEIEAYRQAQGELIKFVNHRTLLTPGSLQKLLDFADKNLHRKPVVYFSNGVLPMSRTVHAFGSFDHFVRNLSFWSSWSTGMTVWKSDLEPLLQENHSFNELFPHTDILFHQRKRELYLIDNSVIFEELPQGNHPKGHYDLFHAFGVEYPWILCSLLKDGSISSDTFRAVKEDNLDFVAKLWYRYCFRGEYCSYDLTGLPDMYGIFYGPWDLKRKVIRRAFQKLIRKLSERN